jgi:hypothetical protein
MNTPQLSVAATRAVDDLALFRPTPWQAVALLATYAHRTDLTDVDRAAVLARFGVAINRDLPVTATADMQVKTITVRDGRKVVDKRVAVVRKTDPTDVILSLAPAEAAAFGRRLGFEADAITGGAR